MLISSFCRYFRSVDKESAILSVYVLTNIFFFSSVTLYANIFLKMYFIKADKYMPSPADCKSSKEGKGKCIRETWYLVIKRVVRFSSYLGVKYNYVFSSPRRRRVTILSLFIYHYRYPVMSKFDSIGFI